MLDGTNREIAEVLLDGEASATDIAEELGVSIPTAHRHLQSLEEGGYVRRSGTRRGETRPYELYAVEETASVFSLHDGRAVERTLALGGVQKLLLSILEVPQEEFHLPLLSYLVDPPGRMDDVAAVAVYGPVARGDALPGSDVDLLVVTKESEANASDSRVARDEVPRTMRAGDAREQTAKPRDGAELPDAHEVGAAWFEERESADEQWAVTADSFTEAELREGIEHGDEPVRSAVSESIVLYDPNEILRDAKAEAEE